jgi:hypothetical protein
MEKNIEVGVVGYFYVVVIKQVKPLCMKIFCALTQQDALFPCGFGLL